MTSLTDRQLRWLAEQVQISCERCLGTGEVMAAEADVPLTPCGSCGGKGKVFPWKQLCYGWHHFPAGNTNTCCNCGMSTEVPGWVVGIKEPYGSVRPVHEGDVILLTDYIRFYSETQAVPYACTLLLKGQTAYYNGYGDLPLAAAFDALARAHGWEEET